MKRAVAWKRPEGDEWKRIYTSKCGRYTIRRKHYASGRNGHFATIRYIFADAVTGKHSTHDRLIYAKDEAEYANDPQWEP